MNSLAKMIAEGKITVEELANAETLIERAKFVRKAIQACKKTITFPLGISTISCYDYTDRAGEYHSWGECTNDGVFTCYCNWGGDHKIGFCNLTNFAEVFIALGDAAFSYDLERFLKEQIKIAN